MSWLKGFRKNQLDEMQEQKLLHIEKNSFWLVWGMLFVILMIEFLLGFAWKEVAGEFVAFMAANIYLVLECLHHGIWDRHLRADWKTNLLVSLLAGAIVFVVNGFVFQRYLEEGDSVWLALPGAAISATMAFAVCFLLMNLAVIFYKKKVDKLEDDTDEEA